MILPRLGLLAGSPHLPPLPPLVVAGSALRRHVSCRSAGLPEPLLVQKPCKELRTSVFLFAFVHTPEQACRLHFGKRDNASCAGWWLQTAPELLLPRCLKG